MTAAAITLAYDDSRCHQLESNMSRWEPHTRARLEEAALELYGERGFDRTTVAEIAERAGLTERTFFRHFADKREVLFSGGQFLTDLLARTAAETPDSASPIVVAAAALDAVAVSLQDRHDFARKRARIIEATPELRERELIKLDSMAAVLAVTLAERGVAKPAASLVAEVAIAVLRNAFQQWVEEANQSALPELIRESLGELKALTNEMPSLLSNVTARG